MQNSKYSKILTIALIIIIILIIGLLIFWGVSALNRKSIEEDQQEAVAQFNNRVIKKTNTIKDDKDKTNSTSSIPLLNDIDFANMIIDDPSSDNSSSNSTSSDGAQTYKGFPMVGYIEIKKTNKKMPILAEANKKALEASVAVLYGVGLNKPGNTVIVGHNYRNGTFFSNNNNETKIIK